MQYIINNFSYLFYVSERIQISVLADIQIPLSFHLTLAKDLQSVLSGFEVALSEVLQVNMDNHLTILVHNGRAA